MNFSKQYLSPIGCILLASDGESITGLWFEGQKYFPGNVGSRQDDLPIFHETERWLDAYFAGTDPGPVPPVRLSGSDFRLRVWEALQQIPYGKTTTYGELARKLGVNSAQAIGGAVGHNPVSVLVPCHRVLGADGSLTGYAGGTWRKEQLLRLEGIIK